MLKGIQNLRNTSDARLPITLPILQNFLSALQHTAGEKDCISLLRATFLLAFHGFFRLGELVARSDSFRELVLQRQDVTFVPGQGFQIILRHFKNMKNNQPVTIILSPSKTSTICPVQALHDYLKIFRHSSGPLFVFQSGAPVMHSFVVQQLKVALAYCDLNPQQYKGHSFRIGAATEAAKLGYSENFIQQLGRWQSNAIKRYLRINSLVM
jgi:hypothetical protein